MPPAPADLPAHVLEDDAAREPAADPENVARTICLAQLTAGPRTRAQLAGVLARRNVPAGVAERVLSRLAGVGLIDDAAYARAWVESRHSGKGLSRQALAMQLRRRGIAEELIEEAVSRVDADQELHTAGQLALRRARATEGLAYQVRLRRLIGVLTRKGYPPHIAFPAARAALTGARGGDAAPGDEPPAPAGHLDPPVTWA